MPEHHANLKPSMSSDMNGASSYVKFALENGLTPELVHHIERSLISFMLKDPVFARRMISTFSSELFTDNEHKILFDLISERLNSIDTDGDINLFSLVLDSAEKGLNLDVSKYYEYAEEIPSREEAYKVADALKEYGTKRLLTDELQRIIVSSQTKSTDEVIESVKETVSKASLFLGTKDLSENAEEVINETLLYIRGDTDSKSFSSAFPGLDDYLFDFSTGNTIVVGARPGVGKTSWALRSAVENAKKGVKVKFFSLEMTRIQVGARIMSILSENVAPSEILAKRVSEEDFMKKVYHELDEYNLRENLKIHVGPITLSSLIRNIEYSRVVHGTELFFVDYAQLVKAPGAERRIQIMNISNELRRLSVDLNVGIVILSQLRRTTSDAQYSEPFMADLKEAGELEQDASLIIMMWRPKEENVPPVLKQKDVYPILVKIEKQRNGPAGHVKPYAVDTRGIKLLKVEGDAEILMTQKKRKKKEEELVNSVEVKQVSEDTIVLEVKENDGLE